MPSMSPHFVLHHSPLKDCVDIRRKCAEKYDHILKRYGVELPKNYATRITENDEGDFFYIIDKKTGEIVSAARAAIASEKSYLPVEQIYKKVTGKYPYWRSNMKPNTYLEGCEHWVDIKYHGLRMTNLCIRSCMIVGLLKKVKNYIVFNNAYTVKHAECFGFKADPKLGDNGVLNYPDDRYPSVIGLLKLSQYASKLNSEEYRITNEILENVEGSYSSEIKGQEIRVDYSIADLISQPSAKTA